MLLKGKSGGTAIKGHKETSWVVGIYVLFVVVVSIHVCQNSLNSTVLKPMHFVICALIFFKDKERERKH